MHEYPFLLPLGLQTPDGTWHRRGVMRLATARDEIESAGDPRTAQNEAFFGVLLLSRVIRQLGTLPGVTPDVILALPAADYAYLQGLYSELNAAGGTPAVPVTAPAPFAAPELTDLVIQTECPHCGATLEVDVPAGFGAEP